MLLNKESGRLLLQESRAWIFHFYSCHNQCFLMQAEWKFCNCKCIVFLFLPYSIKCRTVDLENFHALSRIWKFNQTNEPRTSFNDRLPVVTMIALRDITNMTYCDYDRWWRVVCVCIEFWSLHPLPFLV